MFRDCDGTLLEIGDAIKRVRMIRPFTEKVGAEFTIIVGFRTGGIYVGGSPYAWTPCYFKKVKFSNGARHV